MMGPGFLPMLPVYLVDVVGSALMIAFSLLCVCHALALKRKQPHHLIWTYLLWFSAGLLAFSVSRSGSHLIRHLLGALHQEEAWIAIRPVSGSLNTLTFILVGAITLFFSRVYDAYCRMEEDKAAIERAHSEIVLLNSNLERMVDDRTKDLSTSEAKYRRVFEGSKDMLFICDAAGRVHDVNPSGLSILGFEGREGLGERDLFQELLTLEAGEDLRANLEAQGFVKDVEVTLRRRDGREVAILLSATVRRGEGGEVEAYEGTAKDITLRRDMQRQLLQADKLASLGQLSAGVAHEINNPLGLILGYTQLILRGVAPGTQLHEDLKIIEKHTVHCKKIVEDLLKFSRTAETSKSPVDLNDLLKDVLSVVKGKFAQDRIEVEERLCESGPLVTVDPDKIKQLFMNLVMNARQAITPPGRIIVATAVDSDQGQVIASVTDTGSGIPREILHRIFDPFFTTKPTGMGTGLGLSVSYGIVEDHQGEIRAENAPGGGTTFTVALPISDDEKER